MMINPSRWLCEVTIPLVAEEIAALCNTVSAGASMNPGIRGKKGGLPDPQVAMDDGKGTEDEVMSMDDANRDRVGRFAPGTFTKKQAREHLKKRGYSDDGWLDNDTTSYRHNSGASASHNQKTGRIRYHPHKKSDSSPFKSAADEIATLMAGHDVSHEGREHGKFAPGGANKASHATTPTGSPLDPATGQAEPPKQSAIHKERYDAHTDAAKTYHDLVKQHLNLAKIALDPQDRQKHIDQARQHKQAADQHIQQAEQHALAHSKAVTTEAQMAGQGAGGMMAPNAAQGAPLNPPLGQWKPQPVLEPKGATMNPQQSQQHQNIMGNAAAAVEQAKKKLAQGADPNNQTQQMPAVGGRGPDMKPPQGKIGGVSSGPMITGPSRPLIVPPNTSTGEGTLPAASQQPGAQMGPKGTGGYKGKPGGPLQRKQAAAPRPGGPGSDQPVKSPQQQIYEARTQQLNKSRATPSPAQPAQPVRKSVSQMTPKEKAAHYTKQASMYVKGSPAWQQAMSLAEMHNRGGAGPTMEGRK